MLHFILGRAACGKTEYLHKKLGEVSEGAVLIVPEQFTFETDKGILNTLGAVRSNKIEVLSFTRIAECVFSEYGIKHKDIISEQGRLICMSMALSSLEEKLELYKNHISDSAFIKSMLFVVDEFKQSANSQETLKTAVSHLESGTLKDKMRELMLICDTYDAIVETSYLDTGDVLEKLCEVLKDNCWFKGKTVAIDGFTSFNAQIMRIIEQILIQASDVYITLCADGINYSQDQNDIFSFTRRTASKLKALAAKNSVPVQQPILLIEEVTGYKRYTSDALYAIDENLYKADYSIFDGDSDSVKIFCAKDIEDECAYTSRKIRQLMREGYRCRDIAVIFRDADKYEKQIRYAFKKYEIPTFEDSRQPILNQPLVLYIQNALKICSDGFDTESIMRFLKTGLTPLCVDEISTLENYVYLWQIDRSQWKNEFFKNPFGFGECTEEDKETSLKPLNEMREAVVLPLISLKESMTGKDGFEMTKALYEFLIKTKTNETLKELAIRLEDDGENDLASEQEQIWDLIMQTLNETALALKDKYVSIKKYSELFNMSLSVKSLGRVPNAIDEVIVGSADRIRARGIKAVFVLGANTGVFPAENSNGGLISDRDRNELLSAGIELFDTNKYKSIEERFIAYNAVCCAGEKVYLTYLLTNNKGEKKSPSELVTMVREILPNVECIISDDISIEEKIEGETAAFELLAANFRENSYYSRNLLYYFNNIPRYAERIAALKRVSGESEFEFEDSNISTELFGKNMYLSASKAEEYENCPFKYFCRYGMSAYPRKTATLDPAQSGTIVHYVLEELIKKYKDVGIENTDSVQRNKDVTAALRTYAEKYMGGLDDKNRRFIYHFNRLAKTLDTILERLVAEFKSSSFKPCDFELEIGRNKPISPYTVELKDGGKVEIFGFIDRVDEMTSDGKKYIRVVDYKTGVKQMQLSDVLNGLNMQMLIYLFAVTKNGKNYYGDNIVPAGVLYLPARIASFKADRDDGDDELDVQVIKNGKMSGIVLDDTRIIKAMDDSEKSVFIPASVDLKKGKATGNIISLTQLENLNKKIDGIIADMAESLHEGKIPAYPVYGKDHDKTCDYCDYKSVCCHEQGGRYRYIKFDKHEECLKKLSGGEEDEQKLD